MEPLRSDSRANRPPTDPLLARASESEGYKILSGRYVIYQTLGEGGIGVVFKGRHDDVELDIAIKCLDPDLARRNTGFLARFRKEAQAAAGIRNENPVQVTDVAEDAGLHYLAMEFVRGENARTRVTRKGQLALDEVARIALGIARGLSAVHRSGMIHRDIKPDNVLFSVDGSVKVAELGLVKLEDSGAQLRSGSMSVARAWWV